MRAAQGLLLLCLAPLGGCSTLLDSITTLDETTRGQQEVLDEVRDALVGPGGATLTDQLMRTRSAVERLAGEPGDASSLAEVGRTLVETRAAVEHVGEVLEGVLVNTESLVWPEGGAPAGAEAGGSILAGVHDSTSKLADLVPDEGALMLIAGALGGAFLAWLLVRR